MKAVVYSSKSTEDVHDSIPTQEADARALADREDWEVVGAFSDEAFSAYSGNRGPGLEQAKALAVSTATEHGACILVAQDADRFARGSGDAPGAADHLGEVYFAMKRQRVTLWSVRSGQLDLLRATLEGERSTGESARNSQAVRAGLKRRAERGQPVGALPLGYTAEATVIDGAVVSKRLVDSEGEATVHRMFDLAAVGTTPGDISRQLNSEGRVTARGGPWTTRAVRTVLRNADYIGGTGYPAILSTDRFEHVQGLLGQRDLTGQRRAGTPRAAEDFPLSSVVRCGHCGAAMRSRRCSTTGRRTYRCSNAMEGRHLCRDSRPVDAREAESTLVGSLMPYATDLDAFLAEQVSVREGEQREREAGVARLREQLDKLDRSREKLLANYTRQVEAGRSTAYLALELVERLDGEREAIVQAVRDAEAVLAEHAGDPDLDSARDLYQRLLEAARGRLDGASPGELGAVVRSLFTEVRLWTFVGVDEVIASASLRVVEPRPQTFLNRRLLDTAQIPLAVSSLAVAGRRRCARRWGGPRADRRAGLRHPGRTSMSDDGPPIIMCTTEPPLVEPPKLSFGHALKSARFESSGREPT